SRFSSGFLRAPRVEPPVARRANRARYGSCFAQPRPRSAASGATMKATDLLKHQHREIRDLFERLERAKDDESKSELFEELATNLVAHDAIERRVFYPACEERMGMSDLRGEALVEHGLVEFSLYLADQARGEEDF